MKDRIDARQLSRRWTQEQAAAASELSPQVFETLRDMDESIGELLTSLEGELGGGLPPDTRLAGPKKLLLRLLQVYTRRQDAFNARTLEALSMLQRRQRLLESRLHLQNQILAVLLESDPSDHEAD